ncbi:Hypothetical protein PHPALM_11203 [Phytophthora palmivora]|uniref:Uncharacterized protein n=1 Tax=Phytophthora palmivora TaxID=4796 RepID=A0A2P4Y2T3_9STRA|nr:Hypothetical protein PHPALM_11203 [Phytophthora palmivora]
MNRRLFTALGATVVNGHGWMTKPAATFSAEAGDKSQFIATIESSSSGLKGTFNTAPADNVASFTKAFGSSKYKSLKELIDDKAKITVTGATLTCGTAEPDATPQPLPATVEWSHSDSEGFTPSHEGPCEVWCDNVRAFQDENCAANFKSAPAELPYEKSKCTGASKLTFYWMAMHGPTWQVISRGTNTVFWWFSVHPNHGLFFSWVPCSPNALNWGLAVNPDGGFSFGRYTDGHCCSVLGWLAVDHNGSFIQHVAIHLDDHCSLDFDYNGRVRLRLV